MIAKIGQIVPSKVEKRSDVSKSEPKEDFSKVLKKSSQEAKKSNKTEKHSSENDKKTANAKKDTQESVVCTADVQISNQPVQEKAVLNLVAEMTQVIQSEAIQADSKLSESIVPVDIKVSAMQDGFSKQSVTVEEQQIQNISDNTQNTKLVEQIEAGWQFSDTEFDSQAFEKNQVGIKTNNVANEQTLKSDIKSGTDKKSGQTQLEIAPKTVEKAVQKVRAVNAKSDAEPMQGANVSKSDKTTDNFEVEVSDISVANKQPKIINEIIDKVFAKQDVETKEVIKQVLRQIDDKVKLKLNEFSFDLYPKELGKIAVKMAVKSGMLVVDFLASSEKTQSILASNAGEIKSLLESQMSEQTNFIFASQNSNTSDYLQQQKQDHNSRQQQSQQQNNQQQKESNENFTQDFMSIINLVSQFKF